MVELSPLICGLTTTPTQLIEIVARALSLAVDASTRELQLQNSIFVAAEKKNKKKKKEREREREEDPVQSERLLAANCVCSDKRAFSGVSFTFELQK